MQKAKVTNASKLKIKSNKKTKEKSLPKPLPKRRINHSTDTLVAEHRPSKSFLDLLDEKATIIQRWYRTRKFQRQSKSVDDDTTKRRREMEEKAKLEILKELKEQRIADSTLAVDTQSEQPDIDFLYDDDFDEYTPNDDRSVEASDLNVEYVPTISEDFQQSSKHINPIIDEKEPDYLINYAPTPIPDTRPNTPMIDKKYSSVNSNNTQEVQFSAEKRTTAFENVEDIVTKDFSGQSTSPTTQKYLVSASAFCSTDSTYPETITPSLSNADTQQYLYSDLESGVEKFSAFANNSCSDSVDPSSEYSESRPLTPIEAEKSISRVSTHQQEIRSYSIVNGNVENTRNHSLGVSYMDNDNTSKSVARIFDLLKSVEATPPPVKKLELAEITSDPKASVFDGIKSKIIQQQLEIENKAKMIESLKAELQRQRECTKAEVQQLQKSQKSQMNLQRKEYEGIVKRHLGFIDNLMKEKEELTKKSIELTEQLSSLDQSYQSKIKSLEQEQTSELKKQREIWQAGEKIKREKWIQEKTKLIRDQTVSSLEPEIQKLIAQHKVSLRQAEESYRDAIAKEKTIMMADHQRNVDSLVQKHNIAVQKACEEEREFARVRYQKQLERDEMEFQNQKRKLQAEFENEKHRLQESANEHLKSVESGYKRTIQQLRKEMDDERNQREEMMEDTRKKYQVQISQLQQQFQIEKEEWQSNYMKKVEQQVRNREKQFREQMILQRDQEIEIVIQRLESESGSNNSDAMRRYRLDVERIKSETAEEIKQLRDQHSLALDKLLLAQNQIQSLEEQSRQAQKEVLQLQHQIVTKDNVLRKQKQELARLQTDESRLMEQIRQDFDNELRANESKIQKLETMIQQHERCLEKERTSFRERLEQERLDKEGMIKQVEEQVLQALQIKDRAITELQEQLNDATLKAEHLEALIEKQRTVTKTDIGTFGINMIK